MKRLKSILLILSLLFVTQTQAQIWKKLGKKIEKAAEKTIEKKVEEKTERETSKAFDSTFNKSHSNKKSNSKSTSGKSTPSKSYSFTHRYIMQIEYKKKKTVIDYYLNSQGNYMGINIPDEKNDAFSVMDFSKKRMFMYMNDDGHKMLMSIKLDINKMVDDAYTESNTKVTQTGNTKTILGYLCKEYLVEGDKISGNAWITHQAGVAFSKSMHQTKTKNSPNQSWMSMIDGIALESNMIDTSKRKPKTIKMSCIALKKEPLTINSSDYKKLM